MRKRMLAVVAALALVPAALQAQKVPPVSQAMIDRMIPLLQAEATLGGKGLDAKLAAVAMTKTLYQAHKNALMIAAHDDGDPGRLVAIKDDLGARQVRQANAQLYHGNAARLSILSKLRADPGCGLCAGPTVPTSATSH